MLEIITTRLDFFKMIFGFVLTKFKRENEMRIGMQILHFEKEKLKKVNYSLLRGLLRGI